MNPRGDVESDGIVRFPPAEELLGKDHVRWQRARYYSSQCAKSLLKDLFELNSSAQLDPIHPTTSFSGDQMIQFARAVGSEKLIAFYSMLEDLLMKARVGSAGQPVTSRYTAKRWTSRVLRDPR